VTCLASDSAYLYCIPPGDGIVMSHYSFKMGKSVNHIWFISKLMKCRLFVYILVVHGQKVEFVVASYTVICIFFHLLTVNWEKVFR
jgi:hypothetical protein